MFKLLLSGMLSAIDFDNKSKIKTDKVGDVGTYGMLASKA